MSDKKKNNYDNRLISLHHRLGLYIVNVCVERNVKTAYKNEQKLLCINFILLKLRERTSRTIYNLRMRILGSCH